MKLKLSEQGLKSSVHISHRDEELVWPSGLYRQTSFDLFEHINAYWETKSDQELDLVFDIYRTIGDRFDRAQETVWVMNELITLCTVLLDTIDLLALRHWLIFHAQIYIPGSVPDSFVEDVRRPASREKTYIKDDYKALIALTVCTRAMIPIWGRFIDTTKGEAGSLYKEINALRLVQRSAMYRSDAMNKLRQYIGNIMPQNRTIDGQRRLINWQTVIINGPGLEDFDLWMLAQTLIRKISITDIRGVDPNANLISFIHSFIHSKIKNAEPVDRTNAVQYKSLDRTSESAGSSDADGTYLENIMVQTDLSIGDICAYKVFARNYQGMYRCLALKHGLEPDFQLVRMFHGRIQWLLSEKIDREIVHIVQAIVARVMYSTAVRHLKKIDVLNVFAVAQAVAWQMGYPFIAILIGSKVKNQIGGEYTRTKLDALTTQTLDDTYPYRTYVGRDRSLNPASVAIDQIDKTLTVASWHSNLDPALVQVGLLDQPNTEFLCPMDFRRQLTELMIKLNA